MFVLLLVNRVPLKYTLRNLTVRWITTALTLVAFIIVIGLMVVMLAFTTGMKRMTEDTGEPTNVLVLSEGADDEVVSTISGSRRRPGNLKNVVNADPSRFSKRKLASRETYLIVNQPVANPRPDRPRGRFLQIRGVVNVGLACQVHGVELHEGGDGSRRPARRRIPTPRDKT